MHAGTIQRGDGAVLPQIRTTDEVPILELHGVAKSYGQHRALRGVDLTVRKGEFISLLGPSGSGKTTLLNLIAGSITPDEGRIVINGRDVTHTPPSRRGLGMVFQNYALMPHMNVFENVAFPLRVRKVGSKEIEARVVQALDLVQLADFRGRRPKELSGGQQQRVAIARCMVYSPDITLMDEPLGALDKRLREQMQFEIKELHRKLGMTVIYVTHDQEEALSMSNRIALVNRGRFEQVDTPVALYAEPRTTFAANFLGDSNMLPGRLTEAGEVATVELPGGAILRGRLGAELRPGQPVKAVVRPQCIAVGSPLMDGVENRLETTVESSAFLGGVVKHVLRLGSGELVIAMGLNSSDSFLPATGEQLSISWRATDTLILADNDDAQDRMD